MRAPSHNGHAMNASHREANPFATATSNLEKKTVQPNDNPIGTRLSPMS
jgi:hypothetical protein